jgi:formate C-acetyltransferase
MDTLRAGVRDLFRKLNRYGDAACALNLGGAGAGGEDCFNALSSLFVDVAAELGLPSPILAARIHPGIPDAAFDQLTDPRLLRMGQPTFYGEFPCQEAVARRGVAPAEVHEWAANSCMGLLMPGQEISDMWAGVVPMLLAVELAVNRGMPFEHTVPVDMPDFGHVQRRTFDQLFDDVLRATAALVGYVVERNRAATARVAHESPNPFLSALIDDCILRDRDRADGGARYHTAIVEAFGLMNAADALGAIRALVYERRAVTLREMVAAAKADFVRHEDLLACIRSLPKYGQGDERADAMAARLAAGFAEAVESHNGGTIRYAPSFHTLNAHIAAGRKFGAGLDGRRAGTPLAKNIGPAHDRAAAHTSVMMAACRIDQRRFCGGQALDLSVDAESLVGMRGRAAFQALLQTYFREGGLQVQVNGVTADLLRAARRDPQRHPNVIVRIAGYSARFVALSPDVQDEMIARFDRGL